jgi:acyl-CoA dehydrogenase
MTTEEIVVMMEEIIANGAGFSAAQAVHDAIYNSVPLVKYGSEGVKADLLPEVARDETSIETVADRDDEYVINGQKIWISRVDVSDYMILMARTTPAEAVDRRSDGLTMFLVDLDERVSRGQLKLRSIDKTASNMIHSFELFFDDLRVPTSNVIGEVGSGFYQMLDGLNEERLVIAAECVGLGEAALEAGANYATEREVFGEAIGSYQGVSHPLAEAYVHVQAAKQIVYSAASAAGEDDSTAIGTRANMSKFLAAAAAFEAADAAVQAHGGFGVAREYDVERYMREARLTRLVPITQQLALNFIAENPLDLPRTCGRGSA